MKTGRTLNTSIAFVLALVSVCCLLILILSTFKLPEISVSKSIVRRSHENTEIRSKLFEDKKLGKFGEVMIDMLPNDLAFTVFVPSEETFERDLKLQANDSLTAEMKMNDDTYAVLSRVLGFSAVPRSIYSSSVEFGKVIDFDSLSGFRLYVRKEINGMLMVNGVRSRTGDLRRGEIVVHVMDGVIMDADFQQSI